MDRRQTLKLMGGAAAWPARVFQALPSRTPEGNGHGRKDRGNSLVQRLQKGIQKGAKDFNINATMVGPANVDPAQQVKLLEDLIAKKVA